MRLILFGGAAGDADREVKMIGEVIRQINPQQVLHIPFARTSSSTESQWKGDWFHRYTDIGNIVYLNAENNEDIAKAESPLVFISGGSEHINLYDKINANQRLLDLIKNAEYIVGESAGSMVLGEYQMSGRLDGPKKLMKGLNIIKDTVIRPHYTERNLESALDHDMKEAGVKYGIGIDTTTAIDFELNEFPDKYKKIGKGNIEIKYAT